MPELTWHRARPALWLLAGLLLTTILTAPFIRPALWLLAGGLGLALLLFFAASPWRCACALSLFIYTGLLTSVPVGFTLKAPQLLAGLGLLACLGQQLITGRRQVPLAFGWPFLLFLLAILPSLWNADIHQLWGNESQTSIRLIFNLLLLLMMTYLLLQTATTRERLRRLVQLSFVSCLLSLAFGYFQQAGYYLGFYNPRLYEGLHSTFVDIYGPFLRLSPGTFANEYGQILQTNGILLAGYLLLERGQLVQGWPRRWGLALLGLIAFSLLLNFTRASWLVFGTGFLVILVFARVRARILLPALLLLAGLLYLLSYVSQVVTALDALEAIGQRFSELSDITAFSAGQRLLYWQEAWQAFLEHPWIGHGWGSHVATHNVPLELLAETGLLGFCVFYGLMGWIAWQMRQGWRAARDPELRSLQLSLLIAFLGCLAFDLTNHGHLHFVFWFVIALGLATARLNRQAGAEHGS